jgi:hypothetical protein
MSANAQTFGISPPLYQNYDAHTPFGNLAAFKGKVLNLTLIKYFNTVLVAGDLLYPVFNIVFFIVGVVLVVKIMLTILGLLKAKLVAGTVADVFIDRKRREIRNHLDANAPQIDFLTNIVMEALDSQECMQRMMCEVSSYVEQLAKDQLFSNIADKIPLDLLMPELRASKNGDKCHRYKCGKLPFEAKKSQ